jgi:hypothetical protein
MATLERPCPHCGRLYDISHGIARRSDLTPRLQHIDSSVYLSPVAPPDYPRPAPREEEHTHPECPGHTPGRFVVSPRVEVTTAALNGMGSTLPTQNADPKGAGATELTILLQQVEYLAQDNC